MITRYLENMVFCACCAALYLIAGPLLEEVQRVVRDLAGVFEWMAK